MVLEFTYMFVLQVHKGQIKLTTSFISPKFRVFEVQFSDLSISLFGQKLLKCGSQTVSL